jgi:hypothetical protein
MSHAVQARIGPTAMKPELRAVVVEDSVTDAELLARYLNKAGSS